MKRLLKIIVALVVLVSIILGTNFCYATVIINPENITEPNMNEVPDLVNKASVIVAVIRNVGIVVSVIALMIIGIKAMTGSIEQKADYKKSLPGYILGVIMVIAITVLPSIIYEVVKNW